MLSFNETRGFLGSTNCSERSRSSVGQILRLRCCGEFVVICEQTVLEDAVRIAERIRLTVSATPLSTQSGPVSVTCSLGVMTLDQANFATVEDLLCGADERLYLAKASGRNCVRSALDQ